MENHEKVLLLVCSAAFKGATGLLTTLLEGDALNVTSDGLVCVRLIEHLRHWDDISRIEESRMV